MVRKLVPYDKNTQKIHRVRAKPECQDFFRVQPSNFILTHAVEYIEYTHQYSGMIKIQIGIIVAPNERNLTA